MDVVVKVDPAIPKEQFEQIERFVPTWAKMDLTQGDTLRVEHLPWSPDGGSAMNELIQTAGIVFIAAIFPIRWCSTLCNGSRGSRAPMPR